MYADSSSVPQEPDLTTVKEHKRQRKHVTRECDLPEDIEIEDNPRDLPESEKFCEVCGEPLEWIGEDSGAKSSAIYFSLIETAKENGLDPYRYLTWVLKAAPKLKEQNQFDEQVSTLLPTNAPEECWSGKKDENS